MIATVLIRTDILELLSYASRGATLTCIGGSESPDLPLPELASRFHDCASANPRVGKPWVHLSVRLAPRDRQLSLSSWLEVGRRFVARLNLEEGPVAMYLHTDIPGEGPHLHIVGCMVRPTGERVDMSKNYRRVMSLARELELSLGLYRVPSIAGKPVLPPNPVTTLDLPTLPSLPGVPPPGIRQVIRDSVLGVLRPGISLPEFSEALAHLQPPVQLTVKVAKSTAAITGLGFRYKDHWIKASEVDRSFSLAGLQREFGLYFNPASHTSKMIAAGKVPKAVPVPPPECPAPRIVAVPVLSSTGALSAAPVPLLSPFLPTPITPEVSHVSLPSIRSKFWELIRSTALTVRSILGLDCPRLPRTAPRAR